MESVTKRTSGAKPLRQHQLSHQRNLPLYECVREIEKKKQLCAAAPQPHNGHMRIHICDVEKKANEFSKCVASGNRLNWQATIVKE